MAGGDVIMPLIKQSGVALLPVDNEHCAIWQCLWGEKRSNLDRILITASGGPFRGMKRSELMNVSVEKGTCPSDMEDGRKITIDSPTMMNKGLEVIEAHHLLIDVDRIDIARTSSECNTPDDKIGATVQYWVRWENLLMDTAADYGGALYYPERGPRL